MSDRNPEHLEPTTRSRFEAGRHRAERLLPDGFRIIVTCTWRDHAGQMAAHTSGASDALPGKSYHNPVGRDGRPLSYAIDWMIRTATGRLLEGSSALDEEIYRRAAQGFKQVGFRWSGDWPPRPGKVSEVGHVQAPISLADAHAGKMPDWPPLPAEEPEP